MTATSPVVDPRAVEIDAEHDRAHHAAEPALAAGHRGPAERDREQHGGEREREQREIDAAAAQDEKAREPGEHRDRPRSRTAPGSRCRRETSGAATAPPHRRQGRRTRRGRTTRGRCGRPGCSAPCRRWRRSPRRSRWSASGRRRAARTAAPASDAAATSSGMYFCGIAAHSNFWMRSPNRPRGRNSSTSTISRYIEASLAAGSK